MKFFAIVLVVLVAAASSAVSADELATFNCSSNCPCINREDNFSDDNLPGCPAELETSLLAAVNQLRKDNLLSPLKISTEINQYSQSWATYLAARNIYYHETINKYGSDLVYSYRLHSDDTPINGHEAVDFWINTNGIAARAGNEFENNLDALFDPRSESIGFGCALAAKSLERASIASARSYERQGRYFVVANIEVNLNKPVSPSCYYDQSILGKSINEAPEAISTNTFAPSYSSSVIPSSQYPSSLYASSVNPSSVSPSSVSPSSVSPSSVSPSSVNPSTNPSLNPSTEASTNPSTKVSNNPSTKLSNESSTKLSNNPSTKLSNNPSTNAIGNPSTLSPISTTLGNPTIPDLIVTLQSSPAPESLPIDQSTTPDWFNVTPTDD